MTLRERLSPLGNMNVQDTPSRVDSLAARVRRPADRAFVSRAARLDDLTLLAHDVAATAPAATGPKILVLSLRYMPDHLIYEHVIAQALRLRGADVHLLSCGGGMPICEIGWSRRGHPRPCDRCGWQTDQANSASGLPSTRLADTLPWGPDGRRAPTASDDAEAAELADVSGPWFLRAADPDVVPNAAAALTDFAVSVEGVRAAARRVLDEVQPDLVFMLNGLFAAERAIAAEARGRDLRVVTYEIAPRKGTLVFSQDAPAPEYDTTGAWVASRERPLDPAQSDALDAQLLGRVAGTTSHERYFDRPEDDLATVRELLDIPEGKRVVSLFTNLSWDSASLGHDVAYPSMNDWMAGAVRAVEGLDDTVLVVRVHPAELRWGTRELALDSLEARVTPGPNVRLVGSETALSSYALLELSDLVLVYTSTVGLEASVRGIPVAVAGLTHYRDRGFTTDLTSHEHLAETVRGPLPTVDVEAARRYAFTFFFRAMLPLPVVGVEAGIVKSVPTSAAAIAPGANVYVDHICDRILDGAPFTLPDELALA